MNLTEQAEQVIHEAIEMLYEKGWTKGTFDASEDGSGPYCVLGAINRAQTMHENLACQSELSKQVTEALYAELAEKSRGGVIEFNDNPNTTFEDVVLFLKHAAHRVGESKE